MDLARSETWVAALDRGELDAVAACVGFARRARLTRLARFFSRLGNGWLYPIASALLLVSAAHALRYVVAAAASIGIAHLLYPRLKRILARTRPCDLDPALADVCLPLDRYSCPSGHAMTAAAFGVPIIILAPAAAAPIVVAGWLLVSGSRVALGHHYWSDIVIGSTIGGAIGAIIAAVL
ncbi:MAG TPA: phosphatase PAP2 family protein [Thermoanaerobaculia bacterium]|nr:phosphatase PAP2 family protein [Thermoanaerobaculia bacterium]